jgi:hypothetical protein
MNLKSIEFKNRYVYIEGCSKMHVFPDRNLFVESNLASLGN